MPINHGGEIAYKPAGLQPLLVRDYPTEFGAGLRRGVCAPLTPLCMHRVDRVHHGARP
jgi:hypothetical protein